MRREGSSSRDVGTAVLLVEGTFFLMGCNDAVAPEVFVLCRTTPAGDHVTAGRQQRTLTMNILKLALLGSLRIAFFGFLKVALCAYTLFLSDTAFAGTAREGNGQASDAVSYGPPEGNSNANMARRDAMLPAARARP